MSTINYINYSTKNLTQYSPESNAPNLLHLPQELLQVIMNKVADEPSHILSAIRAVEFGRVCAYTHKLTHEDIDVHTLIGDEKKFTPFVELLSFKLPQIVYQDEADICLVLLRYIFEARDFDSQNSFNDLLEDFERDHPNVENLYQEFTAHMKAYYEKEPKYKVDLFKVYYTFFKKSVVEIFGKEYAKCSGNFYDFARFAGNGSRIIGSDSSEKQEFSGKIHTDIIDQFAGKPIEEISIDEYKYLSSELPLWFTRTPQETHELFLRQAILRFHNKDEIEAIRDKYANPSEELLTSIKIELKDERTESLMNVDEQINYLCGGNFNGAIDAAYRLMRMREQKLNTVKSVYQSALMAQSQEKPNPLSNGQIFINGTFETYKDKLKKFEEARNEFEDLKAELAQYAVWTNGVISGGKKFELEAGLQEEKLTTDARAICKKNSEFYEQLGQPINEENKSELYKQLNKII